MSVKIKMYRQMYFMGIMELLCEDIGYSLELMVDGTAAGYCDGYSRTITLDNRLFMMGEEDIWSVFFHEFAHAYSMHYGIHGLDVPDSYSQMIRGERKVDTLGKKYMRDFFPALKYIRAY